MSRISKKEEESLYWADKKCFLAEVAFMLDLKAYDLGRRHY